MSLNGESDYHPIEHQPQAAFTPEDKSKMSLTKAMFIALLVGALCFVIGAGVVLSSDDKDAVYDRTKPFVSPDRYILSASFRAPYFEESFSIPITAYVDHTSGFSRIEYYAGANVWIHSKAAKTTNYSFQPLYDRMQCFESPHEEAASLPSLFPRLQYHDGESGDDDSDHGPKFTATAEPVIHQLYKLQSQKEKVNDVLCDVWKYNHIKNREGTDYESWEPDQFGQAGNYTFYVDAKTGIPVRFHQLGHNVWNGGSHLEEYIVDYSSVVAVSELPAGLFKAPSGMRCKEDHDEISARFRSPINLMVGSFSHATVDERIDLHDELFESWSKQHQKIYANAAERKLRKENFFTTKAMIDAHNANEEKTFTMELNKFADFTAAELALTQGRKRTSVDTLKTSSGAVLDVCTQYVPIDGELPKAFSWTEDKNVGPYFDYNLTHRIHSQISCGSCWASASTCALTAANIITNGKDATPEQLAEMYQGASVQHTLDCTNGDEYDVHSCNGGIDSWGYSWVITKNSGAVASDNSYGHFLDADGFCHYAINDPTIVNTNPWTGKDVEKYATLETCEHIGTKWNGGKPTDGELVDALKNALFHHGPVSISIAVPMTLYYYKSGIYNDVECKNDLEDLAHSIVAVGWGVDEESGEEYILAANSWSSMWGEKGLVRFQAKGNICGFATVPVLPHVQKV